MDGFDIISKLGDGTYSEVYKVRRKEDNKIYALKKVQLQKLSKKERENSLNEVRILASIKSNFVISYKEAFIEESDKSLCIIMEYADKGDLLQKIKLFKKIGSLIDEIDVWKIFIQMTKGLKALHDLQILHRDLKSANIFLFSDGSAKIGDLNVSKVVHYGMGVTQTGTPYYASPEVWENEPYDSKSDIWSLGCVTYEMIALHPPFRAENMEGLYNKVIKGEYPKISSKYSNDIAQMIDLLLQVKPQDRPTCLTILKHPYVQKRIDFFQAESGIEFDDIDNIDENQLLKTIRIPKNILGLGEQLPKANYNIPKKAKMHIKIDAYNKNKSRDLIFKNKDSNFNNSSEIFPNINTTRFISQSIDIQNNSNNNNSKREEKQDNIEENQNQKSLLSMKENENKLVSPINKVTKIQKVPMSQSPPISKSIEAKINEKIKITNPISQSERKYKVKLNNNNYSKKKNVLKSYLQNLGLEDLYKIYKEKDDGYNKINTNRKYNNYINKNITNKGLPNIFIINNNSTNNYNYNYNGIKSSNYSYVKKGNIRKIRKYY